MTQAADIVPEDFDLNDALHARTTTDEDDQPRCPECGSFNISHKVGHHIGQGPNSKPGDWRCNHCQTHFDVPERGEARDE